MPGHRRVPLASRTRGAGGCARLTPELRIFRAGACRFGKISAVGLTFAGGVTMVTDMIE